MTTPTRPRRQGRPTRAEASAKALAGVDPSQCDPVRILQLIAMDKSAAATARVAACRVLLGDAAAKDKPDRTAARQDAIIARSLELLGRPN
jgi:hypothetical protein